ncbi:MAG TPA: DUF5666 domain-containing protein [Acidobacteriaceae bacterium]|nr:DUF5666 domain-containing protein [Acidobacteriaceae bacterium]
MRFRSIALFTALASITALGPFIPARAAQAQAATPSRVVGAVTAVGSSSLTVKPDKGAPITITVADNARILETQPGAKTLAGATHIQLSGISVGDRVLAAVKPSADGSSLTASMLICMKQSAIAMRRQAEEAAWRKGVGGLVKTVDPATGTITIASGPHTITVHTTPSTTFRRYSPNSIQFADTTPSTIATIHPGDQLRARGPHAPAATELTANAVVSGAFRNIAATVISTDPAANTVTIHDLATKKPVVIHINAESQMHKLPQRMAEYLATRFKHSGPPSGGAHPMPEHAEAHMQPGTNGNSHAGDDLSQMLARTPTMQLSDLHKGNAVMIVATQGTPGSATAVALIAGVEPILTASPSASKSVFSASWNVGGGNASQSAGEAGTP